LENSQNKEKVIVLKKLVLTLMAILVTILLLAGTVGCNAGEAAPTTEITILHTNDMHGRIAGDGEYIIGIDRIAAIRQNTPNSILIDAGDTLHGLPIATLSRGEDIASLMKDAGYIAMGLGNHEFNYGQDRLIELRDIAGFPFLASNVVKNGEQFLDDTLIVDVDGVKIGIFGIVTEATSGSAMPDYVRGLSFGDPIEVSRLRVAELQEQNVHLVVAICHLGITPYAGTLSTELASQVPGIDIIIDGHSHTGLPDGIVENGVLIVQAGHNGSSIGKVTVSFDDGVIESKTASLISFDEAMEVDPDEFVAGKISVLLNSMAVILETVIGESNVSMSSDRSPGVRTQEMPLGSIVADAYREAADADIAVSNGGDIRADINEGAITKGDVISVLPFGNTLMVKNITPAVLFDVLENSVSGIVTDDDGNIDYELSPQGRFLQISGFNFLYDPTAPESQRVLSVILDNGTVLQRSDDSTLISLAASNYIMTGGDYYTMLEELPVLRELGSADEALAEFIQKYSPIDAPPPGRIILSTD